MSMTLLTFDDDWAALYDSGGHRLYEGHTTDVRDHALRLLGIKFQHATPEQEQEAINSGGAPKRLS